MINSRMNENWMIWINKLIDLNDSSHRTELHETIAQTFAIEAQRHPRELQYGVSFSFGQC